MQINKNVVAFSSFCWFTANNLNVAALIVAGSSQVTSKKTIKSLYPAGRDAKLETSW